MYKPFRDPANQRYQHVTNRYRKYQSIQTNANKIQSELEPDHIVCGEKQRVKRVRGDKLP